MRRRLPMLGVLALLPVVGLGACARQPMRDGPSTPSSASARCDATSTPSPATVSAAPTTDASFYAQQGRLDEMATKVTAIAAHYPRVFAGVELAPDHSRIIVFRIPSAPFDSAVRAALPGEPVSIVDAAHSARELDTLLDRVSTDDSYWRTHGVPLNWMSPQVDGSCLLVATSDPVRAKPLFRLRYGPAPIQLIHGDAAVPDMCCNRARSQRTGPLPSSGASVARPAAAISRTRLSLRAQLVATHQTNRDAHATLEPRTDQVPELLT